MIDQSSDRRSALRAAFGFAATMAVGREVRATGGRQTADPDDQLRMFLRTTGDISGEQSVSWATGSIYAWTPGIGGSHLFDFNLFGVQRLTRSENGWLRLGRKAGLYVDKASGRPLTTWRNPFIERDVEVVHLNNNPSIIEIKTGDAAAVPELWTVADTACFIRDIFVTRPADMTVDDYPLYAQSNTFKFAELFHYFASQKELTEFDAPSVAAVGSNTRIGNWLPWMEMGQRRGWLISQVHSKKMSAIRDLPRVLLDYWEKADPGVFQAPTAVTAPNQSSWSAFKARVDAKRAGARR